MGPQVLKFIPSILIGLRFDVPLRSLVSTDHGLPGLHLLEGLFGPHLPGVLEEEGGVERGGHGATHRDAKVRDVANLRAKYIAVLLAILDLYTCLSTRS